MEAVFRDMIRDVPGLAGPYDLPFCLEGPGKSDPPANVLDRLTAAGGRVRPASACPIESNEIEEIQIRSVVERQTGTPAIILNIGSIQCSDERHCSVECGYFSGSLSASGNTFEVAHDGREWVVTSRRLRWIS